MRPFLNIKFISICLFISINSFKDLFLKIMYNHRTYQNLLIPPTTKHVPSFFTLTLYSFFFFLKYLFTSGYFFRLLGDRLVVGWQLNIF